MRTRKVFLEGFVELKRDLFRGTKTNLISPNVTIEKKLRGLRLSVQAIELCGFQFDGNACRCNILSNGKDFAVVEDSEGVTTIRKHSTRTSNTYTLTSSGLARTMVDEGYEPKKHYKVTSPEKGVMVIHKE